MRIGSRRSTEHRVARPRQPSMPIEGNGLGNITGSERLRDRYAGCLLGLACGDALGGPVEFESRSEIERRYSGGLREFVGGGWLHLAPGEITDDTQMTLALARSLADCPDLDMEDLTARFLGWLGSKPKDIGGTTRTALHLLEKGVPWQEAGERVAQGGRAAGNGSV